MRTTTPILVVLSLALGVAGAELVARPAYADKAADLQKAKEDSKAAAIAAAQSKSAAAIGSGEAATMGACISWELEKLPVAKTTTTTDYWEPYAVVGSDVYVRRCAAK